MKIVSVPIKDLIEAEYNPRRMTESQVKNLTASIDKFGMVDPIIVNSHEDRKNVVVGGHQRLKIAKTLGFVEVPVHYIKLNLESERELNLRLNKNTGEWDHEILANNFDNDFLIEVGFDPLELGLDTVAPPEDVPLRPERTVECPNCHTQIAVPNK